MLNRKIKMLVYLFGGSALYTHGARLQASTLTQIRAQDVAPSEIVSQILAEIYC